MSAIFLVPAATVEIDGDTFNVAHGTTCKLDAGAVPYAVASVELPLLDDDVLGWLDPRGAGVRVPITATMDGAPRVFDLGLRGREVDHKAKTVTLTLASDEALLRDYAALTEDRGARAHEASARAVVDYALGKIGAALEPGTDDADLTAYFPVTNLHPNPRPTSAAGYGAGFGAGAPAFSGGAVRWTPTSAATDSNLICAGSLTAFRVTPGKTYVFAVEWATANVGRQARAAIQWRNNGSASTLDTIRGPLFSYSANYQRMHVIATAPAGAEFMYPLVLTSGTAAPLQLVKEVMVYEGDELVPFLDGATPDTAIYRYDWADPLAPNASSSTRTPLVDSPTPAAFRWAPGVTAWDFLAGLLTAAALVLWCDEQRRWFLARADNRVIPAQVNVSDATASEGTDTLSRDDSEAYVSGIVLVYTWRDDAGIERKAFDSAGTPEKPLIVPLTNTPYPGPGAATAMLARRQGTGRVQRVTATTRIDTTPGMAAQVSLPGASDTLGRVTAVEFDLRAGFMALETAGLIDVAPGDWLAVDADLDWDDVNAALNWEDA